MKLTLVACGSRGDHQPHIPLGLELQDRGHEVTVMADEVYADSIASYGIAVDRYRFFADWSWTAEALSSSDGANEAIRDAMQATAHQAIQTLVRAYERSDAVVLTGLLNYGGIVVQRHVPKPHALIAFSPVGIGARGDSSIYAPESGTSLRNLAGSLRVMTSILRWTLPSARAALAHYGEPESRAWTTLLRIPPMAFAVSRRVAPATGRRTPATGFLRLQSSQDLDPDLLSFLDAGTPPVFLGAGTLSADDMRPMLRARVRGALAAGARVVTSTSTGLEPSDVDDRVHLIDEAPFDKLFPRCSLVVHHGGSGTTATALAAGVPQLVTPIATDQPYFARRMHELGVGLRPVPFFDLTGNDVAAAVREAPCLAPRAAELGAQERSDDGAGVLAAWLESVF